MRRIRYQEIADALRARISAGEFAAGRVLPSESELSTTFDASRVTIRKALEVLRDESLVDARQGFGWYVATDPIRQPLGRLATIEEQMASDGIKPERQILEFAFERAKGRVAKVLGNIQVLRVKRLNLADGEPFALVTVWCPANLAEHLSRADVERSPFYELMNIPLTGATQTIGATLVEGEDAALLGVPLGSPVLRCERITESEGGRAVLLSQHVFPAHRTEFVVDLPHAAPSMAPSGLRLVE
jgi:GntR family transcriptional regulator